MTSVPDTSSSAEQPVPAARRNRRFVTSYREGRTCAHAGCDTVISRYNKESLCWHHADERDQAGRRVRE